MRISFLVLVTNTFLLLNSCSENEELGIDFFQEESFVVTQEESLQLSVATFFFDSLSTTNSDRLLVGYHQDDLLGTVQATAFFQLLPEETAAFGNDDYRFDSLTMVLNYDGYYFYDTLQPLTLSLYRVTEEITLEEDTDQLYNASSFTYESQPLASVTIFPHPLSGDSLEIRLPDVLGQDFFDKIEAEEEALLDTDDFVAYFNGVALVAEGSPNGAVLGFAHTSNMKLHYSDVSVLPVQKLTRLFSIDNGLNFNRIQSDRTGTILEDLDEDHPISAHKIDDRAFIQGGVGIVPRIDFSNLIDFQETQTDEVIIASAELSFYPQVASLAEQARLPTTLNVSWVDEDNTSIYENVDATLILDNEFGRDTRYVIDVTDFVYNELNNDPLNSNGLALFFDEFEHSLDRIVIGPRADGKDMVLTLFILDLKEN